MKKLIGLIAFCIITIGTFAQTATVNGDEEQMKRAVEEGVFMFTLPETATVEQVQKSANFYTDYFTVDYNDEQKTTKIVMIDNDAMTRRIITRFLISNKIQTVDFNGENYTVNDFYEKFMMH